jgi:hypothetical protein
MGTENGHDTRGQSANPHLVITVTDRDLFKLDVGGQFPTLDYALNMLDQARRELEAQWRLQRAQQVMQKAADQALANQVMGRR